MQFLLACHRRSNSNYKIMQLDAPRHVKKNLLIYMESRHLPYAPMIACIYQLWTFTEVIPIPSLSATDRMLWSKTAHHLWIMVYLTKQNKSSSSTTNVCPGCDHSPMIPTNPTYIFYWGFVDSSRRSSTISHPKNLWRIPEKNYI